MSHLQTEIEYTRIQQTLEHYLEGARNGSGDTMRPAFHPDATVFGYVGEDLLAGSIELLYQWNDNNGPAEGLQSQIAAIDLTGTVATVRVELENWTGFRFTDLFTLLKVDGDWKVINKVFHLHA